MGFRENLKTELSYSGMLVKELAAQAGLKKHTIDNYLSVRGRMPAADVAVRIARVLGISIPESDMITKLISFGASLDAAIKEEPKLKELSKDTRYTELF